MSTIENRDQELRREAIDRLKKRSDFWTHLTAYVLVNTVIIIVWFVVGGGFFWPIFPLVGWGIGLFFHGMDVFRKPYSEQRIRREMDRLH